MRLNVTATHNIEPRNKDYKRDKQKSICEVFPHSPFWNTCDTFDLSFVTQAYAADLAAADPGSDISLGSFVGVKTITIEYPAGSPSGTRLDGKNQRIEFSLNGTSYCPKRHWY